jgi:fibronectin-binding autotransporter adhesin
MAGYTRQDTANNIANGNVIDADDFDAEYNAIESGFNASTGHKHDGSAGEGAPITKVGPSQDLTVSPSNVLPKTTNTLDLGSNAAKFKDGYFDGTVVTDALTVTAGSTLSGNVTVGGTLGVTGATTLSSTAAITGNTTVGGTLGVTGASTLDSAAVTNNATVGGTLGVTGNTTVGGTLGVTGASTLDSAAVTNNATVGGTLGVTGNSTFSGTLGITSNTTVGGDLDITGNTTLGGTLGITGATTFSGGVNVGSDTIEEYVQDTVGGMVAGNTETGLSVTYDDTNGKLDFALTKDPVITLTGDVTGTGTMTNLGDVSIATTVAANQVALGTDTTGNYVAGVTAGTGVSNR